MTEEGKKPLVSILMAVYNGETYLKEAVTSILQQTLSDFEFIIVNDGSTDSSKEILNSFNDKRISIISNDKNIGVIKSLNKVLPMLKGEYVARMDCDDVSQPDRFIKEVEILNHNANISVVAANVALINAKGIEVGQWNEDINAKTNEEILKVLPYENCIANPTVMIRSSVLLKYRYNPLQKNSEDWDLWMRIASGGGKFFKINEPLVKYRIHPESVTSKANSLGVYKNKKSIQLRYFISRIIRGHVNTFDLNVLKNGIINYFKFVLDKLHPAILPVWTRVRAANLAKVLTQFYNLYVFCSGRVNQQTSVFFFFPYFHIGGAEKVHIQILDAVKDRNPICFITGISSDNGFYEEFKERATLVNISLLVNYPILGKVSKKLISNFVNKTKNSVTFGCNSKFYYELIPYFNANLKCIDLIHAFVHKDEDGPEYWSLSIADRLDKRIVITPKTIEDLRSLYLEFNKKEELISKVEYISNFTDIAPFLKKQRNQNLKVIYVGRNGKEKRIHLIGKIATNLIKENINAGVELIGNLGNSQAIPEMKDCSFNGLICDAIEMQKVYSGADILLITSSREGFPMVIMEAMANGLVVISTNVGGIQSHIINGENGVLISSTDEKDIINDFVNAISELDSNRNKLSIISWNAYNYAKTNFGREKFVESYRKLLLSSE